MSRLRAHKATGPDGISPHILKNVLSLSLPLCLLFRSSLDQGSLPNDWFVANICAIHKKGSKKSPNNYRPVSLTSQAVKLFEKVILEKLIHFCNKNNIFTCEQHGFQSGCSCLTNLLECLNDWTSNFDIPNTGTDIIYTDFKKAFDSVPHRRLLLKTSSYGIRGKMLKWLTSFLSNRKQRVVLNGTPSEWSDVISGVPQGTILGPILFLLYVNDIPERIQSTAELFADDCKIYRRINSREDLCYYKTIWTHWRHGHVTGCSNSAEKSVWCYA